MFLLKRTEMYLLYILCKVFSFIVFDKYQLKIILSRNLPPLLKVAANLFQALTSCFSVCSRDVFYTKWKETSVIQ